MPRLHSVTELVGHDDGERERPELVEELVRQVVGVPRNEVALRAVEGVLSDVLVVGVPGAPQFGGGSSGPYGISPPEIGAKLSPYSFGNSVS